MTPVPDEVIVGRYRWTVRRYTPKRRGGKAGHGWIRPRDVFPGSSGPPGEVEVGAREAALVDEVARLRALLVHPDPTTTEETTP